MNWEEDPPRGQRRLNGEAQGQASICRPLNHPADRGVPRTHYCGILRASDVGEAVVLAGWVARRRDLGGLIFVDLRDRSGTVQLVFDPSKNADVHAVAGRLRAEYVIAVSGHVAGRDPVSRNSALPTGDIEIRPQEIEVLNESLTPPFYLTDDPAADETLRLRYRYLDLRRPAQNRSFALRHRITQVIRRYFDRHDFLEIETPALTRSTPEGARDFLVPSRLSRGKFYALPQSPQLFKQLLMVAGFDRYFQIARCFRDEDLRADRQPEFTQIDVEMSFVAEEQVMSITEGLMLEVLERSDTRLVRVPFPRITYAEAMARYGTDRPDMRFEMDLQDLTPLSLEGDTPAPAFSQAVENAGEVRAMVVPGGAGTSRKVLDSYAAEMARFGIGGLAAVHFEDGGPRTSLSRFYGPETLERWRGLLGARTGDMLLIAAGPAHKVRSALGQLRLYIARERNLVSDRELAFVWVTEFPLLEMSEQEGRLVAVHHPFTAVHPQDRALMATNPVAARARAYDLVLNGVELGGGSIRNYRRDQQMALFEALGMSGPEAEERFGFLLEALDYGAPPHGGIALGLDRMVMMLAGLDSIRDCIAFPKTSSGACLLTGSPAPASSEQVRELGLEIGPARD